MRLVADENTPRPVVLRLRQEGHEVIFIEETSPGQDDIDVLAFAYQEQAVLLTDDKDFGNLVIFQHRPSFGIIFVRLEGVPLNERSEIILGLITQHENDLPGAFTVVARNNIRIRPIQP